jgi:hypothetical protein
MMVRVLPLLLVVFAVALFLVQPAQADDKVTHEGTFVSFHDTKLVMTDKDGKEHTYTLASDAKVNLNGKPAKIEDFKKGTKLTVTTKKETPTIAMQVDGRTE